jgi:uncharacterized protein (DUF952 family)
MAARTSGMYGLGDEGFVHFSYASQLAGTVARYYAGEPDLVVLVVDEAGLDVRVEGGFPHLYEPLPVDRVASVMPLSEALASVA